MAAAFVVLFSILMIAMGIGGGVSPARLRRFASRWQSRSGLWAAGLLRVALAIALWAAAPASRTPQALQVLAAVSLASGLTLPLIGPARFERLIDWFLGRPAALIRGWCLAAALLGAFFLWSVGA